MKRIFICFIFFIMLVTVPNLVEAQSVYVNSRGVAIDMEYYERLCSLYSVSYVEYIDNDEYQEILSNGFDNIVVKQISDFAMTRDYRHDTANKSLKLIKQNNNITLLVTWKSVPKIKTYDVIGVRFGSGISLNGDVAFKQLYADSNGKVIESATHYDKYLSNGFGCSFKVGNGTNHEISIKFQYAGTGTVYGSYQHAKRAATLDESQKYTISSSGYGGVFAFDSSVKDKYDAMGGVDLKV